MASSIIENTHQATALATIAVPDAGTMLCLQNIELNDHWRIGELIPRDKEKHATVYIVLDIETGLPTENLEAHVFVLDHKQPKLRKHRLRCINRMKHRTKLEFRVEDLVIIVISTLQATDCGASEKDGPERSLPAGDGSPETEDGSKSNQNLEGKTPYKRESARIRQRERRKAKRSGKVREQHSETADGEQESTQTMEHTNLDDEETDFTAFLILLSVLYDATGTMRKEIPQQHADFIKTMGSDALHESLTKFLKQSPVKLESPADMESYLKAKRGEMISLRRQLARVSSAEKYHHDKLGRIDREQAQHQKHSEKWQEIEEGSKAEADFQLQTVIHAKTVLPRILSSQKNHVRSMERKRARAIGKLASMKLSEHRERLVHNVAQYEKWASTVFPLSHAREDLLRWLEEAMSELAAFDHGLIKKDSTQIDGAKQ